MTREEAIRILASSCISGSKQTEALETLIPELRESEDERIRKEIVGLIEELQRSDKYFAGVELTDMLAYLEKQKESGIKWLKSDNVKNPEKPYIDKAGMFYTTDGRMCYASEIEKQKEQKPDWSKEEVKFPNGKFVFPKCLYARTKDNKTIDISYAPQDMTAIEYVRNDSIEQEQNHWEWSEEEGKILDSIIDDYEKAARSFCGYDGKIGLLRAIRDGEYNLPKPAWGEEDEKLFWGFTAWVPNEELERLGVTRDDLLKKLKSLRPQPKQETE